MAILDGAVNLFYVVHCVSEGVLSCCVLCVVVYKVERGTWAKNAPSHLRADNALRRPIKSGSHLKTCHLHYCARL